MLTKLASLRVFREKIPNQISTWLSQLAEVGGETEMNIGMLGQPVMVFLVGAVIVEDDVNLLLGGNILDHIIQKRLEVGAFLGMEPGVLSKYCLCCFYRQDPHMEPVALSNCCFCRFYRQDPH